MNGIFFEQHSTIDPQKATPAKKGAFSPLKAIRKKCLDCAGGCLKEIRSCSHTECPLYIFRMGKNPHRKGIAPRKPVILQKSHVESGKTFKNEV